MTEINENKKQEEKKEEKKEIEKEKIEAEKKDKPEKSDKELIEQLQKENKELIDHLQRLQAEFDNYRKRVEKEKCEFLAYANRELILSLLPLLDNFELALKNSKHTEDFVKGVELIYSQFFSLLENFGLKNIESEGQHFDPNLHEALLTEKSDKPENTILEELQKGYMLNDKVLRTAKVKIAKK